MRMTRTLTRRSQVSVVMAARAALAMIASGLVLATTACGVGAAGPSVTPHPDAAPESRVSAFPLALVVHKSRQTLSVYRNGTMTQQYAAVFGQKNHGSKLYEGDLRTPEGLYRIVDKRRHARWHYFLQLDYPNDHDRERYNANLRDGRIPAIRGKTLDIGGDIGIHGSDHPTKQRNQTNWTHGCIALTNDDIDAVSKLVKIGTPVLVLP